MVTKLMGSIGWTACGDTDDGSVHRVILRENGELAVDVTCNGYRYSATLKKVGSSDFDGQWMCIADRRTYVGSVSCKLYRSDADYLLFGKWHEDKTDHYWWAELSVVEHFPDEGRAQQ